MKHFLIFTLLSILISACQKQKKQLNRIDGDWKVELVRVLDGEGFTFYDSLPVGKIQIISESKKLEGSEKLKAIDVANVYKNYLAFCKELNVYETGDVYSEVLRLDKKGFVFRFNN